MLPLDLVARIPVKVPEQFVPRAEGLSTRETPLIIIIIIIVTILLFIVIIILLIVVILVSRSALVLRQSIRRLEPLPTS